MKPSRKKRLGALFAAALIALSAATFNPAAVTAAAAPVTAYYTEIADIPDFGAFAGVGLYDKTEEDFDSYKVIAYLYTDGVDGAKVSAYVDAVVAAGYEFKNESVTKGGNLVHTYAKGTKGVMLVAAPGRFMVGLIDLEAVARYDRFPDIPDFEPYVADVLVSKNVEGDARLTVYTYHCNGDGVGNTMMEYGKYLVQGFGWEYKGLYLEGPTGYAFEKDHMSMVLSCPTATGLDSDVYIVIADNAAASSGYWEASEAEQDAPMTDDDFNAWLMGQAEFSETQLQNYMQGQAADSPEADPAQNTFTMTDTVRKDTSSGNVYTAPLELISQFVGYVNITNPDKVRYGCTIQVTSGKNDLTGLWNSYNLDEDGVPGGTVYTVVDAVVID